MKARAILLGSALLLFCVIAIPARAHTAKPAAPARPQAGATTLSPQARLKQYVADLQSNPNDTALREKIIALAQTMNPPPAIPPSAHQDYVMAVTFVESAKDNTGYEHAIDHFKSALLAAPWWMDAYKKLAIAQKAAGHYDDAIATLNLYLLAKPADASDAQDEIYKLMALKQAAADEVAQKQREQQQAAEAERERQIREQENFVQGLDGAQYIYYAHGIGMDDYGVSRQMVWTHYLRVQGSTVIYWMVTPNGKTIDYGWKFTIDGRTLQGNAAAGGETGKISEDGNTITFTLRNWVFSRQR